MRRRMIRGALAAAAWAWLGAGPAAAAVLPTDPATFRLDTGAPVRVSLYQLDSALPSTITSSSPSRCLRLGLGAGIYRDVTDCWLPEVGQRVYVVIHGASDVPALVPPAPAPVLPLPAGAANPYVAALTTSAYPGQYINAGTGGDPDFTLGAAPVTLPTSAQTSVTGWELVPQDGGGMAVLQIGAYRVILPGDGTATVPANGVPDIWESLYGGTLDPAADADTGPGGNAPLGDGIATFDEYRGALIDGKHARLQPLQKDLVVHLVAGHCPTASSPSSLLLPAGYPTPASLDATLTLALPATRGQAVVVTASAGVFSAAHVRGRLTGTGGGRATIVAVTSPTSAVAEIEEEFSLASLPAGAWTLSESLYGNLYGLFSAERLRVLGPAGALNSPEWVDTFVSYTESTGRITFTAAGGGSDRVVNTNRLYGSPQKGVRIIECLDTSLSGVFGYALGGTGTPNTRGNVIVYTQRVVNRLVALITGNAPRRVQYSPMHEPVLKGGTPTDWLPKSLVGDGDPSSTAVQSFIISRALQFYVEHEVGHSINLNVTASNTPHFAAFSGDALDTAISSKPDRSTSGFNTFYIPSAFGPTDQSQLLLR